MELGQGGPPRNRPSLHVILMAIALVVAAFGGAAAGLVWQSSGLADDGEPDAEGETDEEGADPDAVEAEEADGGEAAAIGGGANTA